MVTSSWLPALGAGLGLAGLCHRGAQCAEMGRGAGGPHGLSRGIVHPPPVLAPIARARSYVPELGLPPLSHLHKHKLVSEALSLWLLFNISSPQTITLAKAKKNNNNYLEINIYLNPS